jgi:hypothetical protein
MTGPSGGASPRAQRVLASSFAENLEALSIEELRRRRDETLAEREFQSYLRRLVQVRQDILSAEKERREAHAEAKPLVERLTAVLSAGPQGRGRGEALRLELSEEDLAEADRRANEVLGDAAMANPETLSDDELGRALEALGAQEHEVSMGRASILRIHDRFQEELKRRYREDPSLALEGH